MTKDDAIDELLNSIDLSTYGLERAKLNSSIGLDSSETEVDPQNPAVRGAHGTDGEESPLDEIIRTFNERHFAGWEATPDEQKVKLLNIARHVVDNPNYKTQVADNPDAQNSRIATEKLIKEALSQERRKEISMYKLYTEDPEFKRAFDQSIIRMLSQDQIAEVLQGDLDV